jgi:hypothetical protein
VLPIERIPQSMVRSFEALCFGLWILIDAFQIPQARQKIGIVGKRLSALP